MRTYTREQLNTMDETWRKDNQDLLRIGGEKVAATLKLAVELAASKGEDFVKTLHEQTVGARKHYGLDTSSAIKALAPFYEAEAREETEAAQQQEEISRLDEIRENNRAYAARKGMDVSGLGFVESGSHELHSSRLEDYAPDPDSPLAKHIQEHNQQFVDYEKERQRKAFNASALAMENQWRRRHGLTAMNLTEEDAFLKVRATNPQAHSFSLRELR